MNLALWTPDSRNRILQLGGMVRQTRLCSSKRCTRMARPPTSEPTGNPKSRPHPQRMSADTDVQIAQKLPPGFLTSHTTWLGLAPRPWALQLEFWRLLQAQPRASLRGAHEVAEPRQLVFDDVHHQGNSVPSRCRDDHKTSVDLIHIISFSLAKRRIFGQFSKSARRALACLACGAHPLGATPTCRPCYSSQFQP